VGAVEGRRDPGHGLLIAFGLVTAGIAGHLFDSQRACSGKYRRSAR
jgi:hypothetical protein